jgi:hypothetical protein
MTTEELITEIQNNTEWLWTTNEDEVECISIENLEVILSRFLSNNIKIQQNE